MINLEYLAGSKIPRWLARVVVIIGLSMIATVVILLLSKVCVFLAVFLDVPIKWSVLILCSLVTTLVVAASEEVHHER